MGKLPLISIVVPVYNIEECIGDCIESVLGQTYKNLEILLVDDGSTDDSGSICDDYAKKDNRLAVIHKKNGGLSDARNMGIEKAKGEYISFVDGDDRLENDYVETLYNSITKEEADISIVGHNIIYPASSVKKTASKDATYNSESALKEILYDREIDLSAWGKLFKMTLFSDIRFPKGRLFEDSATTYKLFDKASKIIVTSKAKYDYVIRSSSITNAAFNKEKYDLIASTKEMCDFVSRKYPKLTMACERRLMYAYLSTLTQLARAAKPAKEDIEIIMSYIKENRHKVLCDKNLPRRDRIALNISRFGFKTFRVFWRLYVKLNGRGI